MNTITQNSEVLTAICTIVFGALLRVLEKRKLRRKGMLTDKAQTE